MRRILNILADTRFGNMVAAGVRMVNTKPIASDRFNKKETESQLEIDKTKLVTLEKDIETIEADIETIEADIKTIKKYMTMLEQRIFKGIATVNPNHSDIAKLDREYNIGISEYIIDNIAQELEEKTTDIAQELKTLQNKEDLAEICSKLNDSLYNSAARKGGLTITGLLKDKQAEIGQNKQERKDLDQARRDPGKENTSPNSRKP